MSADRPRLWIEEPSPAFGWALVCCEFCQRTWFPVPEPRPFAEMHAREHANQAGTPPHVHDEADLACVEPACNRRAHHADGRCRACWVRLKRAQKVAA